MGKWRLKMRRSRKTWERPGIAARGETRRHMRAAKIQRRSPEMREQRNRSEALVGVVVGGSLITGLAGLLTAALAFLSTEWAGTGVCLVAAAIAFGHASNALLRE